MKTHAKLMLAVAFSGFAFLNAVNADVVRTPRGESLRPSSVTVDSRGEPNLVQSQSITGNARGAQLLRPTIVARAADDQLASERPVYTGRTPFNNVAGFEIAPFAKQGKDCGADCQKPCCTKK
jgi:hypothetical protein